VVAKHGEPLWGKDDPIGKTLMLNTVGPTFVVMGGARDVRGSICGLGGTSVAAHAHI